MNVKLIAHTALSSAFLGSIPSKLRAMLGDSEAEGSAIVALTAIRTCYSANKPSKIAVLEGAKYFGKQASDGEGGTDADRLFRHITRSGHTSTLEHITYTFAIEGVSRSLLAQLTRHRQFSFSVQSQRYVKFGSVDKSGGFDYVIPPSVGGKFTRYNEGMTGEDVFSSYMESAQAHYDVLREMGVPAEDARYVLPNAATCNLVLTTNLRALIEFYGKRNKSTHAQWEIADLAELLRAEITKVDAWTDGFFGEVSG
jgi:thymidylate synthase (FAD)